MQNLCADMPCFCRLGHICYVYAFLQCTTNLIGNLIYVVTKHFIALICLHVKKKNSMHIAILHAPCMYIAKYAFHEHLYNFNFNLPW